MLKLVPTIDNKGFQELLKLQGQLLHSYTGSSQIPDPTLKLDLEDALTIPDEGYAFKTNSSRLRSWGQVLHLAWFIVKVAG